MSNPIAIGQNHSFDVAVAILCGVEAAIIFNHIFYWLRHNKINGINQIDGKTWIYESHERMAEYLPYLSHHQVRRALDKLCDAELLEKRQLHSNKFNKTNWYSLKDEASLSPERLANLPDRHGRSPNRSTPENQGKGSTNHSERLANLPDRHGESARSMGRICQIHGANLPDVYKDKGIRREELERRENTPPTPQAGSDAFASEGGGCFSSSCHSSSFGFEDNEFGSRANPPERSTLRQAGTNPRAQGTNPRVHGTNPRAQETDPEALSPLERLQRKSTAARNAIAEAEEKKKLKLYRERKRQEKILTDTGFSDGFEGSRTGENGESASDNISYVNKKVDNPAKTAYREHVLLTEEEHSRLSIQYNPTKLNELFDNLDAYKGSTGKKYKSDYHALLPAGWVNKRYEEDKSKSAGRGGSNANPMQSIRDKHLAEWIAVNGSPNEGGNIFDFSRPETVDLSKL